ncbi:MAG: hypothetical protein IJP66_00205, partial [Kiritimatiellae bacterium]|nr:hypothetical protein [Kiritimatiellia bacterium]
MNPLEQREFWRRALKRANVCGAIAILAAAWTASAGWEDVGAPVRRQGSAATITAAPATATTRATVAPATTTR